MRPSHLSAAALLVAVALTPARAVDPTRIDRTLENEPKYDTREPKYCLVVFGPEAKTRVWLVRDGEVMHVHSSPDGKSAKVWRRVKGPTSFPLGDIWEEGGKVLHKNFYCVHTTSFVRLRVQTDGKPQIAGHDHRGRLAFAASAKDAPVVHFNGPLTLDLFEDQEPLVSGGSADLTAVVGTHGVGPGTFAGLTCRSYPKGAWPRGRIEFPAKEGGKPIALEVRLSEA